jgi:hypothetical protein
MIRLTRFLLAGRSRSFAGAVLAALLQLMPFSALAADAAPEPNGTQVLEAFDKQQVQRVDAGAITEKKKQLIMFSLGVPLLILILATGALGIAMAVFGKQVFVMHMVLAGLTVTLALVHVIVGLVWFYPF